MLAAGTGRAAGLHLNLFRPDLDFTVVGQLRHDLQRCEAGLAAGVGVKGADADQAVDAVLALEVAVGVLALDENGGGLDARFFAGFIVHQLIGVAMALGPTGIHAVEHLRPVLSLSAAGTGVEGENGVVGIVFAGQQRRQTPLADLLFQRVVALNHVGQLRGVILLLCHLAQGQGILPFADQTVMLLDLVLQPLDLLAYLLAALQVVPEAVLLRLLLEGGKLLPGLGDAQRFFQLAQSGLQRQQLLLIFVVFDHCHMW